MLIKSGTLGDERLAANGQLTETDFTLELYVAGKLTSVRMPSFNTVVGVL